MNMNQLVRDYVDRAYELGHDVSPLSIARHIELEYPLEFEEYSTTAARKGVQQVASQVLKAAANAKQQAFPGMEVPQWFTVLDGEGGFAYRPLRIATLADHRADVAVRRTNAERVMQELAEAERRDEQLWSVDDACDEMLVSDALELLQQVQP